ncbi:MAG: hypothetical protein OEW11_04385 [Nitrospirota bacterium]|nr:hypothetical protein [Nitrospirota bacterium]
MRPTLLLTLLLTVAAPLAHAQTPVPSEPLVPPPSPTLAPAPLEPLVPPPSDTLAPAPLEPLVPPPSDTLAPASLEPLVPPSSDTPVPAPRETPAPVVTEEPPRSPVAPPSAFFPPPVPPVPVAQPVDVGRIVMTEMVLGSLSLMAVFSPEVWGEVLVVSAPIVHFASGPAAPSTLRWKLPLFELALGSYNLLVLNDSDIHEARILRDNFLAWNAWYLYAARFAPVGMERTAQARTDATPRLSAGVVPARGGMLLSAALRF